MSTVAIITDTHFGARNDSLQMQENMKRFYDHVFFPTLDAHGVKHVWHGGDYYDRRKYVNFQTANFVEFNYRVPLKKRNISELAILGNHDIFYRTGTDVNTIQEIYRFDKTLDIIIGPEEFELDGCHILMLPWICDSNRDASLRAIRETKCSVILGHLEIAGFQMYRGMPSSEGLDAAMFDRFELVMSGHYHHRHSKGVIQYLGAPYAMTWADYRDPRGFHLFDTQTKELTFVENPYSLFARVVYDDDSQEHDYIKKLNEVIFSKDSPFRNAYVKVVVKSKTNPYWFDLMMDALHKVNAQDIMVIDDIVVDDDGDEEEIVATDIDTLVLIQEYVDSLSINADKNELTTYMRSLYQKSMSATQSVRLS